MSAVKDIRLFTTQSHPCSYLPGEQARTLFIDPALDVDQGLHTQLSAMGFRRSGDHLYRPHCQHCQQCLPCRVRVADFQPSRRFRRILRRNQDLRLQEVERLEVARHYPLYAHYINTRHQDGDMYPASEEQFSSFLAAGCDSTRYLEIQETQGQLLGVMICDQLDDALSAVYTYFDPAAEARSLGSYAILWQIAEAQRLQLPYLYLGYWIRDCRKMAYKRDYRPLELFIKGRWLLLN